MNKGSVSSIVVTYNRKRKLVRCLKALLKQSYKLENIIIIDNASNDGTFDAIRSFLDLKKLGNINTNHLFNLASKNSINIYYFRANENNGGSFGFYLGMKIAHEKFHTDTYWLMDDDGYPDVNCLSVLMKNLNNYDYVMPTSIDIENHLNLSWPVRMKNGVKTSNFKQLKQSWGKVMEFVTPFNGALLTEKCVDNVGYINKKFFIWGDEYDHYWRCKEKGINPVTILSAKFYHPSQKLPLVKICFGLFRAPYVDSKLRMVCLVRNYTYIYKRYNQSYKIPLKFMQYTWLFLITRHFDIDGWILYLKSVHDGLVGDFSRHKKYLNGGN